MVSAVVRLSWFQKPSWILVGFISAAPQRELQEEHFLLHILLFLPNALSLWLCPRGQGQGSSETRVSAGLPRGLCFWFMQPHEDRVGSMLRSGWYWFPLSLVDEGRCCLCTFHLYDGLLRKLNRKATESPSFAHTDTWWWKWVIVPE